MKQNNPVKIVESIAIVISVVIVSVIGALIIGSILASTTFDDIRTSASAINETLVTVTEAGEDFATASLSAVTCGTVSSVSNATAGTGEEITSGNWTQTNCNLLFKGVTTGYNNTNWNISYSYTYDSGVNPTRLNTTLIAEQFGLFITGLLAFLAIIGTIVGVVWLIFYVKMLFDKKQGISNMTA